MESGPMRTLIVEDSGYMADALTRLLALLPGLSVVGQAGSRAEALRLAAEHRPELVLLDLRIRGEPDGSPGPEYGVATLRALRHLVPAPIVVVLSSLPEQPWLRVIAEAGAVGFVSKDGTSEEILAAVQAVCAGGVAFTLQQLRSLQEPVMALSPREREVLACLADGLSNGEIGQHLGMSPATAHKHVEHLCALFGVHSRGQVVAAARREGLLAADGG
jgi:DNA-binding NarL/FixJ family response regulator